MDVWIYILRKGAFYQRYGLMNKHKMMSETIGVNIFTTFIFKIFMKQKRGYPFSDTLSSLKLYIKSIFKMS